MLHNAQLTGQTGQIRHHVKWPILKISSLEEPHPGNDKHECLQAIVYLLSALSSHLNRINQRLSEVQMTAPLHVTART